VFASNYLSDDDIALSDSFFRHCVRISGNTNI
ncbi:MAG: hypothetical protein ACJA01_001076, partial [Saprospiraceae bacterium]